MAVSVVAGLPDTVCGDTNKFSKDELDAVASISNPLVPLKVKLPPVMYTLFNVALGCNFNRMSSTTDSTDTLSKTKSVNPSPGILIPTGPPPNLPPCTCNPPPFSMSKGVSTAVQPVTCG